MTLEEAIKKDNNWKEFLKKLVDKCNNYNDLVKENVTLDSNVENYLSVFLTENSNDLLLFRHKFIKNIDGTYRWISTESLDNFQE